MVDSKVFGVIALKGGVGKTTVVSNLGAALSQEFDKKVLLIDANFSTPHLGLHVGLVDPSHNLHPVLEDEYSIYEAIYQHPLGFHVIPGKLAPKEVNPLTLQEKLEPLREIYDVILIDSSPSLNHEMAATMAASDEVLVVSSPDYPTLSSTLHAIELAKQGGTDVRGIVINKVRKKRFELAAKDISEASETPVLAKIPDNVTVLAALSKMVPVVSHSPKEDVSHGFKELAGGLVGEKYKKRKLLGKKKAAKPKAKTEKKSKPKAKKAKK